MYKKILVGIDPSDEERGVEALRTATHLADDTFSLIYAMSVIESIPGHYTGHLAEEVEGRATQLAMGHLRELAGRYSSIRKEIRHGKPADELIKFAEENEIDCIVIASHKPGLSDYFLGSTAARVVRHAPCTVLVMR